MAVIISTSAKTDFLTFINALLGNKQAQKHERESRVLEAITTALKGNQTKWLEAYKAVHAVKNAKALQAAFGVIGNIPVMFKTQDKTDAAIKAAAIAEKAAALLAEFEAAYLEICPLIDIKPTDAEKATKAAEKATKEQAAFDAKVKELNLVPADSLPAFATDGEILEIAISLLSNNKAGKDIASRMFDAINATNPELLDNAVMNIMTLQASAAASKAVKDSTQKTGKKDLIAA